MSDIIKKVTAFQAHPTNVGEQLAFSYSMIDENGKILEQNKRYEIVVLDEEVLNAINIIYNFLQGKIPE